MADLPRVIYALADDYDVFVVEDPAVALGRIDGNDNHALGATDFNRSTIRLRGGGEQSASQLRDTLLHEVLHIVGHVTALDFEEDTILRMTPVLLTILRDNPALVKFLTA